MSGTRKVRAKTSVVFLMLLMTMVAGCDFSQILVAALAAGVSGAVPVISGDTSFSGISFNPGLTTTYNPALGPVVTTPTTPTTGLPAETSTIPGTTVTPSTGGVYGLPPAAGVSGSMGTLTVPSATGTGPLTIDQLQIGFVPSFGSGLSSGSNTGAASGRITNQVTEFQALVRSSS